MTTSTVAASHPLIRPPHTKALRLPHAAVWTVVGINVAWAVDSLVLAVVGWASPSTVGTAWIIGQALMVGGFAGWQATAARGRTASGPHRRVRP